jgi:hypothetical protein
VWSRDGSELYYWTEVRDTVSIKAIYVTAGSPASWGAPRVVATGAYVTASSDRGYDFSGDRFLVMKNAIPGGSTPRQEIVIAQNWYAEVTRQVTK